MLLEKHISEHTSAWLGILNNKSEIEFNQVIPTWIGAIPF